MAHAEYLDNSIDGFDSEDNYSRSSRRGHSSHGSNRYSRIVSPTQTSTLPPPTNSTYSRFEPIPTPEPVPEPQVAPEPQAKVEPEIAPKAKTERAQQPKGPNIFVRIFTDERLRLFLGISLILLCVFVVIALVSHFKAGVVDQSLVMNSTLSEMAAGGNVQNMGGSFGAKLSHWLLCDTLGLGSVVLIVYAWLLALALLGFKKCHFWSLTFKSLLVAITISVVLGLVTYNSDSVIKWGGTHGHYVNKFLHYYATWIGAVSVSAVLIAAVACVYLNELHTAWSKWREAVNRHRLQEQLRRERERKPEDAIEDAHSQEAATNDSPVADTTGNAEDPTDKKTVEMVINDEDDNAQSIAEGFALPNDSNVTQIAGRELQDIADYDDGTGFTIDNETSIPEASIASTTEVATAALTVNDAPIAKAAVEDQETEDITNEQPHDGQAIETSPTEGTNPEDKDDVISEEKTDEETPGEETPGEEVQFTITTNEIEQADKIASPTPNPRELGPYDHRAELSHYKFPDIELLVDRKNNVAADMEEQEANKNRIVKTLSDYGILISQISATVGPTVTQYEIIPAEGVRISSIKRLEDDIALSLSALGIRIIAPIPGKGTIGIEVPNSDPQTVSMRSVIASKKFQECKMALPMAMGATISNDIFIADMAKMPHMLVAGATGMGKSVGLNAIIASLLYKKHPSELKFVLIDPKMVEFSLYGKLDRHFLAKLPDEEDAIITDMGKVIETLNSLCIEMDNRYNLLRMAGVRSLEEYNDKFTKRRLLPTDGHKYLPYIVVIVDEFADLIMTAGKEVETPIARIAQKARAVGIHMIIATQRPSTNVITGIIKANFPGRIAFRVIQMVDSRTILDSPGANQLIGKGDMLFSHNGIMQRVQCAFISTEEVDAIIESIDSQVGYEHAYYLPEYVPEGAEGGAAGANIGEKDGLFDEAARFVVQRQNGSTSSLQRAFNIGYNRAGRLMDQMEAAGIVGPANGSKPRNILMDSIALEQILENS